MANDLMDFKVTGLHELTKNLAEFGSPRTLKKLIGLSMWQGAKIPLQRARVNARALGLGFMGYQQRRDAQGRSMGVQRRYGRIPPSLKANGIYAPRGSNGAVYRMNVLARSQRGRGVYRNKAPHAHLVEYGFTHFKSRRRIHGRAFLGPALDQTAPQVVTVIAQRMTALIEALKFPTTGRGP